MRRIIMFSLFFCLSMTLASAETLYFTTNTGRKFCDTHTYNGGYQSCTQEQLARNDLLEAGFNGPRFMEIQLGKIVRKVCVKNGKQVPTGLCSWQIKSK